ncbi:hypothetical protein EMIT07CA2_90208 [Brevibacillus sp. IT-7CA2]
MRKEEQHVSSGFGFTQDSGMDWAFDRGFPVCVPVSVDGIDGFQNDARGPAISPDAFA